MLCMLTSLTVKCPQSKEGCNHLCAKRKEERTQVLQEWDEMHFTEPGWGSGMRKKVNSLGREYLTTFPKLVHPGAKKVVETHKGIPQFLSILPSDAI